MAIVNRLAGAEEVCVCDFIGTLGLAQPTVSHHLKVLREAGLVEVARKRGTWVYYRLVPEAVGELAFALGGAAAGRRRERPARAYFVCIGNAGRSQMAQALYERLGGEARSAGSRPSTSASGGRRGDARARHRSLRPQAARIEQDDVEWADVVVTMGCGEDACPVLPGSGTSTGTCPTRSAAVEEVELRDDIQRRLESSASRFTRARPTQGGESFHPPPA